MDTTWNRRKFKGVNALLLCVVLMCAGRADALACGEEESIKEQILDALRAAPKEMPKFIRGVFHDSTDKNNLKKKSGSGWTKISGSYGGVDGCIYAPLKEHGTATGRA